MSFKPYRYKMCLQVEVETSVPIPQQTRLDCDLKLSIPNLRGTLNILDDTWVSEYVKLQRVDRAEDV